MLTGCAWFGLPGNVVPVSNVSQLFLSPQDEASLNEMHAHRMLAA
jgi:hypothetical protein